jgi:hypothetical protein
MAKTPEVKKQEAPKQESTAMVNWEAELAALAVVTTETEKPTGNWVSFQGGQLKVGGNLQKDNRAEVVVIGSVFENQWYKDRYDPNNPTPPHCFALSESDEDLKPHEDSLSPQAPSCAECPKNQWGSDPNGGKGKACKNVRRLALISAHDLAHVDRAEFAIAKLPVTSVKNWSTYALQVANVLKLPPLGVKTEMSVAPNAKTQFQVDFQLVDKVEREHIPALLSKRADAIPLLFAPYDKPVEVVAGAAKKF